MERHDCTPCQKVPISQGQQKQKGPILNVSQSNTNTDAITWARGPKTKKRDIWGEDRSRPYILG
eukprot:11360786-Karenia_brevis.AAC.1